MESFQECVDEYRRQLKKGVIPHAYRGLMEYMMALRTHFAESYPAYSVSGSIYYGYMDMSYFAFSPPALRERRLKIAVVLVHDSCRFEAWLSASNKQVQAEYWQRFKRSSWNKYRVVPTTKGMDSIVESVLVSVPDFANLDALTAEIERGALRFAADIETFLDGR